MAKNLWKFEPRERRQAAEPFRPAEATEHSAVPASVGATLRERREERGEDLRYVAQMLRIRYPYLKAIEEGLVDELPGPTYAIGFVRTYAEHLGLDAKDMVARFKAEVEGLNSRNDLNFPAPIPEGKIPSGAILLVGIIVAALVYAVWIYMSSKDQVVSELAKQPPGEVVGVQGPGPALDGSAVESLEQAPVESTAAAQPETAVKAAEEKPVDVSETVTATGENPAGPSSENPIDSNEIIAETNVTAANPAERPKAVAQQAHADTQQVSAQAAAIEAETPAPPPVPPTQQTATANAAAANREGPVGGEEAAPVASPPSSKVYGQGNTGARIVIHAIADSWVEVRDKTTDELLLTRVLFKGDSYRVPNRAGLTLLTGNAGGLRITVDGKDVRSLGSVGSVRRDIALEPDQLSSGDRRARSRGQSATGGTSSGADR
jgi:cytoskeleton protein RodZ